MAAVDEHFQKCFGIMFTSCHEGEQINALRALRKYADKQKIHWTDVFSQSGGGGSADSALSAKLASLRAECDRLNRENDSLRKTLAGAEQHAKEVQVLAKQNEALKREVHTATQDTKAARTECTSLRQEAARLNARLADVKAAFEQKVSGLQSQLDCSFSLSEIPTLVSLMLPEQPKAYP